MGIAERKVRDKHALRERILDAARRIVMRDGFAALSMRKIADAIEYSPATLYLHFESRDEIARALCAEGYAQLLSGLAPAAKLADPLERLQALAHAYVAFGLAHPQTYRLIFMEDPSYTDAALGTTGNSAPNSTHHGAHHGAHDQEPPDEGDAAFAFLTGALGELRAAGRIPASADTLAWAEALWATLHGMVSLTLTCPVFPRTSVDALVDAALDAWFNRAAVQDDAASRAPKPARRPAAKQVKKAKRAVP